MRGIFRSLIDILSFEPYEYGSNVDYFRNLSEFRYNGSSLFALGIYNALGWQMIEQTNLRLLKPDFTNLLIGDMRMNGDYLLNYQQERSFPKATPVNNLSK